MKPKLTQIAREYQIKPQEQERGKVHDIYKYFANRVGRFYSNLTTDKPKEQDNDYENDNKWGDSGVS